MEVASAQLQWDSWRKTAPLPFTRISAVFLPRKEAELCISLCDGKKWWRTKHKELLSQKRPLVQGRMMKC